MTRYATSQEWLHQSSLLLEARPATTKITSRYSVRPADARAPGKPKRPSGAASEAPPAEAAATAAARPPRAKLVLKTYDPVSGASLVYRTTKAAEVSRLVQMLGTLGRRMAALPATAAAADEAEAAAAGEGAATPTSQGPAPPAAGPSQPPPSQQQGGGGGGKGKKKKGKR